MSIESEIHDLTSAVKALDLTLQGLRGAPGITPTNVPAQPNPAIVEALRKSDAKVQARKPDPKPAVPAKLPVARDDVSNAILELNKAKGRDACIEMLTSHGAELNEKGVPTVKTLPADRYEAVFAAVAKVLEIEPEALRKGEPK